MFVRTTKVQKGEKAYQHAQVVESYRRPDGQPRQRIIASLGKRTDLQVANVPLALQAAKAGDCVTRLVVLGLVAHRLVAPGPKLAAVRWFERTAIPNLLGVEAAELHNSRIHRTLDALNQIRAELQLGVAQLHRGSTEKGHALFSALY